MTQPQTDPKKPAYIAYDIAPWTSDPCEPESVGVSFAHRDEQGFDILLDGAPLSGKLMLRRPGATTTGVTALLGGVPANRPDFHAFLVTEKKDREGKARWRQIGFAYRHADGDGLDVLYKVIPTSGRISLRQNTDQ